MKVDSIADARGTPHDWRKELVSELDSCFIHFDGPRWTAGPNTFFNKTVKVIF